MTHEEVLNDFRQAVERSIADALRVPARDANPLACAKDVWESNYKGVLHESVLDEYANREEIATGRYTPPERRI